MPGMIEKTGTGRHPNAGTLATLPRFIAHADEL